MSEVTNRLRDRRNNVWSQAKSLLDRAADENRDLNSEEQGSWDTLNTELDALDRRMKSVLDGEQRAKDTEEAFNRLEGRTPEGDTRHSGSTDELRAFLRGDPGAPRSFDVKPPAPGTSEHRDLSKLTNAAGKFTVPTSFYAQLYEHLVDNAAVLQTNPTILRTDSGEPIQIPKTLTHTPNPAIVVEADPILESDPTFGQLTLGAFKYGRMVQVSSELVKDTGVDLEGYLARSVGRALGNSLGADLVTGAGTTAPRGVTIDSTMGVTPAAGLLAGGGFGTQTTADQGFDILINLYHSVIAPYRNSRSCYWLMNDGTAAKVRKIKDSTGQYVWQTSVVAGEPDTIIGKPVVVDPNVAAVGANAKSIVFGDWSAYYVRFSGGIRFERSDDFAFANDLVSFRALLRGDGALVDLTGALKHLLHPAT